VSERHACRVLGQHRSVQRHEAAPRSDEDVLTAAMIALARRFGRYGYRKIGGLLRRAGWVVNDKRVERIWRQEGLKVPQKQPKRGRLWLNDGSCIRLRPEYPNHVWSYDFVLDHTHEGRAFRMLTVVDEYTRECLAIEVGRRLRAEDVLEVLGALFVERGAPEHLRSDNGSEFTARAVRDWLGRLGVKPLFIERLLRKLQRATSRRTAGAGDLLHAAGGQGPHRELAARVQCGPASRQPRESPAGAGSPGGLVASRSLPATP